MLHIKFQGHRSIGSGEEEAYSTAICGPISIQRNAIQVLFDNTLNIYAFQNPWDKVKVTVTIYSKTLSLLSYPHLGTISI